MKLDGLMDAFISKLILTYYVTNKNIYSNKGLCTRIRRYYRISSSTNLVTEYISPLSANVEASYQCCQINTSCNQESCWFLNMCLWHMADKNSLKISLQKVNIWIFKQLY